MRKSSIVPQRVRITRPAQDRLHVVVGGGWRSAAGAVFLLPGLALLLIGFRVIPISGTDFTVNGVPVLGLFGLPFFLGGIWLAGHRCCLTFDVQQGVLAVATSVCALPLLRWERSLQEFTAVIVARGVTSTSSDGGSSSAVYYLVALAAENSGNNLVISEQAAYQHAYAQAATIAGFLGVPVRDVSTDHPLEIAPVDLSRPIQGRLRAEADRQVQAPRALRSQLEDGPDGVRISIPWQGTSFLLSAILTFAGLVSMSGFFFMLLMQQPSLNLSSWMIGGALLSAIPIFVIFRYAWMARHSSTEVSIIEQGIRIEERRGRRTCSVVMLPVADLIDIDYGIVNDSRLQRTGSMILRKVVGSEGITVKATSGLYTFGAGLPDAEVEYLALIMRRAVSSVLV